MRSENTIFVTGSMKIFFYASGISFRSRLASCKIRSASAILWKKIYPLAAKSTFIFTKKITKILVSRIIYYLKYCPNITIQFTQWPIFLKIYGFLTKIEKKYFQFFHPAEKVTTLIIGLRWTSHKYIIMFIFRCLKVLTEWKKNKKNLSLRLEKVDYWQ